ncbi:MAG: hypothetical protein AUK35_00935 [Zetaproteobacteria bacterium CG2_30_46_52]|nr:MAG: hypothetical protein AUK35_00935 [Zetaproteobacteria bacterium CG2_30_46_52]
MAWLQQCRIANIVVQVGSDSAACQQDMGKFLCLYEVVSGEIPQLKFEVLLSDDVYRFVAVDADGEQELLWQSDDEREISAALEIHFYRKTIEYLDKDMASIHAALLHVNGKACMFAGVSGAGKSSICTAGLLAGADYFSDEFALLAKDGWVYPFPRPMQWEFTEHPAFERQTIIDSGLISADYFDFPDAQGVETRCHLWHPKNIQRKPLPLTHVVLHQYRADLTAPELLEIPRHEALMALPEHLHIQRGMALDLPMLNKRLNKDCKFYRLTFPNVIAAWELIEAEIRSR